MLCRQVKRMAEGDDLRYTLIQEKAIKGAAFIAGSMSACQNTSLGMLMYYDARPSDLLFDLPDLFYRKAI